MWPEDREVAERIFVGMRLKAALLKCPDVFLTANQDHLEDLVAKAAKNFTTIGYFVCPIESLKEMFISPHLPGQHECPCWKAVVESREDGESKCGLLQTKIPPPKGPLTELAQSLKEKIRALQSGTQKPEA